MGSLTEDLWELILARLPLKTITTYKLVCKQWKSIVEESELFRQGFLFHHKKSDSSWSLISRDSRKEVVAHYGCETWGLTRPLGSYISSFLTEIFKSEKEEAIVLAYTDVGLILFTLRSESKNPPYYVANPISQQCVKIPPPPLRFLGLLQDERFRPGLATRIEEDVLLGYKVVLIDTCDFGTGVLSLLVYSSETGLWSLNTLQSDTDTDLPDVRCIDPITLNGNIYWFGNLFNSDYLVSYDLYAESDRCRVIPFPDEWQSPIFGRSCTISQGFLMYTNIVCVHEKHKLRAWRLLESGEWQLVSEISPVSNLDYVFLGINPFDANTIYMWNNKSGHFASTNLYKRHFGFHNILESSSDGRTLSFEGEWNPAADIIHILFTLRFVLPRWLHRIPSSPS